MLNSTGRYAMHTTQVAFPKAASLGSCPLATGHAGDSDYIRLVELFEKQEEVVLYDAVDDLIVHLLECIRQRLYIVRQVPKLAMHRIYSE